MNSRYSTFFSALIVAAQVAIMGTAAASVKLPATRVIYDASLRERALQFTSQDDGPSVMQVWVDSGDEKSTPKTADAPFIVTPPVFRIEPKAGQTVRLVFTGANLPQDRESVFYLNTLQIPSVNAAYADQNQMMVMLRNRLKLFYRPAGIEGGVQDAYKKLTFSLLAGAKGTRIAVSNGSGYYMSLVDAALTCGAHAATFAADMVAPRAEAQWDVKGDCPAGTAQASVKIHYVDDYGAIRPAEYPVSPAGAK
ncbi:fimbrial biogenesis chaperone [Paraburkholderia dinghuensis]|uniref:Molecular chaperone n=1 Tax=Paraburkholderia dinghuensis TaxID=2305225 RepID=A0A3N6NXJ4_9BURK|nr:molecular chaperone [Paraburkholderia dinghuensis]RQH05493.1 molecular chaperone [Paraburkholderia dinghuensis]